LELGTKRIDSKKRIKNIESLVKEERNRKSKRLGSIFLIERQGAP
jgi:hypothetical protein